MPVMLGEIRGLTEPLLVPRQSERKVETALRQPLVAPAVLRAAASELRNSTAETVGQLGVRTRALEAAVPLVLVVPGKMAGFHPLTTQAVVAALVAYRQPMELMAAQEMGTAVLAPMEQLVALDRAEPAAMGRMAQVAVVGRQVAPAALV